jgi:hypothetical protein
VGPATDGDAEERGREFDGEVLLLAGLGEEGPVDERDPLGCATDLGCCLEVSCHDLVQGQGDDVAISNVHAFRGMSTRAWAWCCCQPRSATRLARRWPAWAPSWRSIMGRL